MRTSAPSVFALVAILSTGLTTGGCSSTPKQDAADVSAAASIVAPATALGTRATGLESTRPSYAGPWEDPSNPLYQRTIYFDYDTIEIKPEYIPVMRVHASYLGGHADRRVTLEGHTDERGTREYNLSLGDQRADAVRRFMLAEGVTPNQMATLSYGEERPADPGHDESSWGANRRVIIHY
jgi:peptidoglycan-associated lipoprotein